MTITGKYCNCGRELRHIDIILGFDECAECSKTTRARQTVDLRFMELTRRATLQQLNDIDVLLDNVERALGTL